MNIAAAVILYYPDPQVVENILSYSSFVKTIYVIDNSETPSPQIAEAIQRRIPHSVYLSDGKNEGIGIRVNQACKKAIAAGFDYLLTMDQDSWFETRTINNYFRCFATYPTPEKVAMYGVQYEHPSWSSDTCNPVEWSQLITSASIVNLALFDTIGGFDEQLFIDVVDFEYCYRSIVMGYQIIQFRNIHINHTLGSTRFSTTQQGQAKTERTMHAPIRLYYMVRNYLYIKHRYQQHFPKEIEQSRKAIVSRVKNSLLHSKKRLQAMKYVYRAIADYKKGKMGKYQ